MIISVKGAHENDSIIISLIFTGSESEDDCSAPGAGNQASRKQGNISSWCAMFLTDHM